MIKFILGMAAMLLICSIALNFYQFGQLRTCVSFPAAIPSMDMRGVK